MANVKFKRSRVRTGCVTCRNRHRKCGEEKPRCVNCQKKDLECVWPVQGRFRDANTKLGKDHISVVSRPTDQIEIITENPVPNKKRKNTEAESSVASKPIAESSTEPATYNPAAVNNHEGISNIDHGFDNTSADFFQDFNDDETKTTADSAGPIESTRSDEVQTIEKDEDELDDTVGPELFEDLNNALRTYMFSTAAAQTNELEISAESERPKSPETAPNLFEDPSAMELLSNYISEVATWLDMFDHDDHFGVVLPHLAQNSPGLMYAILAISSRQAERKGTQLSSESTTLELYQQSLYHLLPVFEKIDICTVSACVILCVLEMMSSSPSSWRKHLEGCAALFSAVEINGFSQDPIARSLFWCFARMDLSCSIIEEEAPIIPCAQWFPKNAATPSDSISKAYAYFMGIAEPFPPQASPYEMYANYAVYLGAQVSELLENGNHKDQAYISGWKMLWDELMVWEANRTAEMLPIATLEHTLPFPTILYTNGPAISGNQMFHTAEIRMLLAKPKPVQLAKSCKSVLWHARRICGISQTNDHHGCLNNALQPLWVAGRQMSHHTEHEAILQMLDRIETTTGWAMRWRGEDLKEFWG